MGIGMGGFPYDGKHIDTIHGRDTHIRDTHLGGGNASGAHVHAHFLGKTVVETGKESAAAHHDNAAGQLRGTEARLLELILYVGYDFGGTGRHAFVYLVIVDGIVDGSDGCAGSVALTAFYLLGALLEVIQAHEVAGDIARAHGKRLEEL
jgi:hypothetical protein